MFELVCSGYEFLSSFLPFLLVLILLTRKNSKADTPYPKTYYALTAAFALYIICVFNVTGAGTVYEATHYWPYRWLNLNLIPFSNEIDPVGYVLNVVMLMPFGFLVPLIWKSCASLGRVSLAGLSFSLLIELSQTLSFRGTDVDDLIMNTLGAAVGFGFYKIWNMVTRGKLQQSGNLRELPAYILALYLGRCFLFNALGLIQLWYGS